MKKLKKVIRENNGFFILFFIYLIAGLVVLLSFSKKEIFFFVNGLNNPVQDTLLQYYTFLGDGIFSVIIVLLLALRKVRYAFVAAVAFILQSLVVQLLKRVVFHGSERPWKMWGETEGFHLAPGLVPHSFNSMPSGHSATAFVVFLIICLYFPYKKLSWIFFFFAMGVAYSRIYLSQHHFIDTYAGAIIGVCCTLGTYLWLNDWLKAKGLTHPRLEKPILKLRR